MTEQFTDDMAEISGFGGGYEDACRKMVLAGVTWLKANPGADPKFSGMKGVYGLIDENNKDAKDLSAAVLKAAEGCSGAMHQAAISHIMRIKAVGWETYAADMTARGTASPERSTPVDNPLELFFTGDNAYERTGTRMSSIYETGTFRRSDWGKVQIALAEGRDVRIRQPNAKEAKWADELFAEYRKK